MNPERMEMLRRIQELEFTAIDLNLYLDTHPGDEKALCDYHEVTHALHMLHMEYDRRYGPLMAAGHGHDRQFPWRWIEDPWPWEICY
ncbi:MAG: spore coat protein CotJB [Firmicutes bacterium]|nr:spore coat protein CotJB [Bacillota bacterium]